MSIDRIKAATENLVSWVEKNGNKIGYSANEVGKLVNYGNAQVEKIQQFSLKSSASMN